MKPGVHDEAWSALGAWVIGACEPPETHQITAHVDDCTDCQAEADRLRGAVDWFGAGQPVAPPAGLRERVLSAALAVRAPGQPIRGRLLDAYAGQAREFAAVLGDLTDRQWAAAVPHHGDVAGLVAHLARNDRPVLAALDPDAAAADEAVREGAAGWRAQSDLLVRRLAADDGSALDRLVPLAGAGALRRPVREALVQRTFETWTHADDIRRALRLPVRPAGAADIRMILDFGLGLLPTALTGLGIAHPGKAVRLVLRGSGGGEWEVPLATGAGAVRVATVTADALDFCRLMAGRQPVETLRYGVSGNADVVPDMLRAASTLGCD